MRRDHRFSQRRLSDAVDDALTPRQQARLARHVDECPECGPMLRSLIRLRAAMRAIADIDRSAGASVVPGVLARLRDDGDAEPPAAPGRAHEA